MPDLPLPSDSPLGELTRFLRKFEGGNQQAAERLLQFVTDQLGKVAGKRKARAAAGHKPAALLLDTWLQVAANHPPDGKIRAQFFAAAAEAMRRVLVDDARGRLAQRRRDRQKHIKSDDRDLARSADDARMLRVSDALEQFKVVDAKQAELVKLRFFGQLTQTEAAQVLGISEPTADLWWACARAWLKKATGFDDARELSINDARMLGLRDALDQFTVIDPKKAELVRLRFDGGLTLTEAAQALGISEPTAERWWAYARAWFQREMSQRCRP